MTSLSDSSSLSPESADVDTLVSDFTDASDTDPLSLCPSRFPLGLPMNKSRSCSDCEGPSPRGTEYLYSREVSPVRVVTEPG